MDAETNEQLSDAARALFRNPPTDIFASLLAFGWNDIADDQEAYEILFFGQGATNARMPILDLCLAHTDGQSAVPTMLWPAPGVSSSRSSCDQTRIWVDAITVREITTPAYAVSTNSSGAILVEVDTTEVNALPIRGIDGDAGWWRVRGVLPIITTTLLDWPPVHARARRCLAAELLGLSDAMLDMAISHVTSRSQFGRPIGANQAVRHRLADSYAILAAARPAIHHAFASTDAHSAIVAKALGGLAHEEVARATAQVCGGMAMSAEFPLAGYAARGYLINSLLGSVKELSSEAGRQALLGATPPPPPIAKLV